MANVDGRQYAWILNDGYSYDSQRRSDVAFFPAYPLLGKTVKQLTGLGADASLLIVSHLALIGGFILMAKYTAARRESAERRFSDLILLVMGLWPMTFFWRMAYSEALFVCAALWSLYAMQKGRNAWSVALITGLATATRPVGVALLPVFLLYLWQTAPTRKRFALRGVVLLPVACWGLLAYMAWLQVRFGEPLAFAKTQTDWVQRPTPLLEKLPALLTLKPIREVYDPASEAWWANPDPFNPFFNIKFLNPLYFVLTAVLIIIGAAKSWLSAREWLLSALLLLIPYVTIAYDNLMQSQARFSAVAFPIFFVVARMLSRVPPALVAVVVLIFAFFLGAYSALFAAGYSFF